MLGRHRSGLRLVEPPQTPATRRDFLFVFTGAFAAAGSAAAVWPLIDQMNPGRGSSPESISVDLAPIRPGQAITMIWKGQPVVIRHRTPDEIARARAIPIEGFPDPYARNAALRADTAAIDANRTRAGYPEWLVVIGLCTYLGCLLRVDGDDSPGWFCPCHAARFDSSGRVRSGPARTNLAVPPYRFVTPTRMEIGQA